MPRELMTGEYSAEPVLDGLWAVYGESTGSGVSARPWAALAGASQSRENLRTLAAVATLGSDFSYQHMMSPIAEGVPLFTNADFHPNVAAALLMPAAYWQRLISAFEPEPATLLAAIPAPSRIFLTIIDSDEMIGAMRNLIARACAMEEELLSEHVYRFDGSAWRAQSL